MVDFATKINQNIKVEDQVKVKVHRFNSRLARLGRWLKGHEIKVKQGLQIDGYVTAKVRRWNVNTQSYGEWITVQEPKHNILTNGGKDFFFQQCYNSTGVGSTSGTYFVGVSNTLTSPVATDTTLTGELAVNGFSRAAGTYAHTNGQTTCSITITFTNTGSNQSGVKGGALFTAISSGTMSNEFTFTSTDFVVNDQLQLIITITFT